MRPRATNTELHGETRTLSEHEDLKPSDLMLLSMEERHKVARELIERHQRESRGSTSAPNILNNFGGIPMGSGRRDGPPQQGVAFSAGVQRTDRALTKLRNVDRWLPDILVRHAVEGVTTNIVRQYEFGNPYAAEKVLNNAYGLFMAFWMEDR